MKKLLPLLAIASISLTACSGVDESKLIPPGEMNETIAETGSPFPGLHWDDCSMNVFLGSYGAASFRGFDPSSPHYYIDSWDESGPGEMTITVAEGDWAEDQLKWLAQDFKDRGKCGKHPVQVVKVVEEYGTDQASTY